MIRDRKEVAGQVELAFGRTVSRLRRSQGIPQEIFAYKAKVNRTYITDIELGRRSVGIGITKKICDALGVSLVEFMSHMTNELYGLEQKSQ